MGRRRAGPSKEFLERISEHFWWSAEFSGDELGLAVVAAARQLQEVQSWRSEENIVNLGFYRGLELQGLSGGARLSAARFLPANAPSTLAGGRLPVGFTMNVVASVVDGAANKIASRRPKPTFITDGGDGSERQLARTMDRLVRGVFQSERVPRKARKALRSSLVFGTGALKVVELDDRVRVEHTLVDELLVDEAEAYSGEPRSIFQVRTAHRTTLGHLYPDRTDAIMGSDLVSFAVDGRGMQSEHVEVFEAWRLPSSHGAGDGRHVVAVEGGLLYEEPWETDELPFVFTQWSDPVVGFWGEGVPAMLRGTQVYINRLTARIQEAIRRFGVPKLVVDGTARVSESAKDREMNVVRVTGGQPPHVQFPRVLMGQEVYDYLDALKAWCYERTGVSEMDATGAKPPGLYSGEAIRQWSDQTSARFSDAVANYEDLHCQLGERVMEAGRRIARRKGSYKVRVSRGAFAETLDFKDVDLDRDRYTMKVLPTAFLPQTFSGKLETLEYLRKNNYVDFQTARDHLDVPDVEEAMDLENAPLDALQGRLQRMVSSGAYEPPDELDDLQGGIVLYQKAYHLLGNRGGDPDGSKRDLIRRWIGQATDMLRAGQQALQPPAPPEQSAAPEMRQAVGPGQVLAS